MGTDVVRTRRIVPPVEPRRTSFLDDARRTAPTFVAAIKSRSG
jgi:hypothetical protein